MGDLTNKPGPWQSCLETIISTDAISSVAIGLTLRDNIPFFPDRAALLEQTWERRYEAIIGSDTLAEPFGHVQNDWSRSDLDWVPLLLLNGTSLSTGRRVLISDLAPSHCVNPSDGSGGWREGLFLEAIDLIDLMHADTNAASHEADCKVVPRHASRDFGLSTAALLSARFPVISPPAAIFVSGVTAGPVDYVVDGGYFDNDGLITARDLVVALKAAQLDPIVIHIANQPLDVSSNYYRTPSPASDSEPQLGYGPPLPRRTLPSYINSLYVPLSALANVRGAHAFDLENAVIALVPDTYFEVATWFNRVEGKPSQRFEVPVSWWLSTPMQDYLHSQVNNMHNGPTWETLAAKIRR